MSAYALEAEQVRMLIRRGWEWSQGWWIHPKHVNQGLPMLFTFEDAVKSAGLQ